MLAPVVEREQGQGQREVTAAHAYEVQLEFIELALRSEIDGTNITRCEPTRATVPGAPAAPH